MRQKPETKMYRIELLFKHNITRSVHVRAHSREVAEARALKRNPSALGVKKSNA